MPASTFAHWNGAIRGYADFAADPPPDESGIYTFESSSIEGGGFQNVLGISPFLNAGNRPYLVGADVSGPFRSVNRGAQWTPVNNGSATNSMRIAAFLWSNETPGKVWMFEDGGIHRSTDWGVTWAKRAGAADADANGVLKPPEHPRQTGNLLAQDNSTATKYLWVGCETLGLRQSIDDGATWRSTVLVGHRITGIAVEPTNPDTIYVSVARSGATENGIWRVTNARGATMDPPVRLTGYPGNLTTGPHELICVDDAGSPKLYIAGDVNGIYRFDILANTWTALNSGLNVNGTAVYQAITADPSNPQILYCGHWRPASRNAIYRSANGGTTWTSLTGPSPVTAPATGPIVIDWLMYGTAIRSWLADIPYHSFAGPNAEWLASHLAIDPDVPGRVLAAGRGGCWWGTLAGGVRTWQPANHGLLVTVCMCVVQDDLTPGRAMVGNMDYTAFYSPDSALQMAFQSKSPTAESTGDVACFDMAVATGAGRAYVGASVRNPPGVIPGVGAIWSSPTPELGTGTHWVNESSGGFDSDVVALSVGRNAAGNRVILASASQGTGVATQVGGLWRKAGVAAWQQFTDGATVPFGLSGVLTPAANMGSIRFRRNSPVVYALDNDALWRSNDAGATWTKILTGVVGGNYGTYNSLELDPVDLAVVYVSSAGIVRRVNNASTSTGTGNTTVTQVWATGGTAGNIAVRADGTEMFINIRDGRLMRSATGLFRTGATQSACTWVDVATPFFRNNTGNIRSLAVTPDGTVMTADNGSGALRGYQV